MNAGKKQYEQIPIPEELDRVIWDSIGRAAREARRRRQRRWGLSAAAVFCAAFISANVAPLYAYAARIPVIGAVVQVLHVGSGMDTRGRCPCRCGGRGRDGGILL